MFSENFTKFNENLLLKDKIVIVTGSSRGIGREIAFQMAQAGAIVIINHLPEDESEAMDTLESIIREGGYAYAKKADVSILEEVESMVDEVVSKFGKIDILVNNAGITDPRFFLELTENDWDKMINVNLKSVYNCCSCAVPHMLKQNYGRIVNISSVVAKSGSIGSGAHYCAAKAGILGFTKSLANEMAHSNITVNAVAPGLIDTRMIKWRTSAQLKNHIDLIPVKRIGVCSDIAGTVVFLASHYADYITGATVDVNGGIYMD
jgi:NAD(P)-dependent dehydrogenase (short-subunit alcohol dehydrogenase family)